MSRCAACDKILTDFEMTRKTASGHYLDLCNHCFHSGVSEMLNGVVSEREDLKETIEPEDLDYEDE